MAATTIAVTITIRLSVIPMMMMLMMLFNCRDDLKAMRIG